MTIDYQAMDEALDEEIRALDPDYQPEAKSEDSPADAGTESNTESEVDSDAQADTSIEETNQDDTQESTVPESRYKDAVRAMNKAQQELAEYRKNEGSKDAYIQQLQQQLQDAQAKQESTSVTDDSDLAEAQELYPEVINPLLKMIAGLENKLASVSDDVGNVKNVANRFQQTEQNSAQQAHFDAIKAKHDDLDTIVNSSEYEDWFHNQAPLIQHALQQGSARDVIAALDLYRAEHPRSVPATSSASKVDKLALAKEAAAPSIKSGTKPETKQSFTQAQIAKMSAAEFAKHESAIDEAVARGEIY